MRTVWRPNNLWLALTAVVALIAWLLTRWITHVDHRPRPVVTVTFDQQPPLQFDRVPVGIGAIEQFRRTVPEIAMSSRGRIIVLYTSATQSFTVSGVDPNAIACAALEPTQADEALVSENHADASSAPVPVRAGKKIATIPILPGMREAIVRRGGRRGAISCTLHEDVTAAPTFTDRAITIRVENGRAGPAILDISALEDVENLRFSGGMQAPLGGDRTRLVYAPDNIVSAEWSDGTALEQRDIILVLIGALSAIAAAMAIEAIRPFVESRTRE